MTTKRGFPTLALGLATLVVALIGVGCARAPEQTIDAAQSALEAAKGAEAQVYAKESYDKAEKAFADAMLEVNQQNEAFVLSRSYSKASEMLDEARDRAVKAKEDAEDAREEWRQNAQSLMQEARSRVTAVEESAAKARGAAKRAELKSAAEKATEALFAAEKAFDNQKYIEAHSKAEDAKALADEAIGEPPVPAPKMRQS
jgi:hypothetical protein